MDHIHHDPYSKLHTQRLFLSQHWATHLEAKGILDQDGGRVTIDLDDLGNKSRWLGVDNAVKFIHGHTRHVLCNEGAWTHWR